MNQHDIINDLRKLAINVTEKTIYNYSKGGLIPEPKRGAGRGLGKWVDYPPNTVAEFFASQSFIKGVFPSDSIGIDSMGREFPIEWHYDNRMKPERVRNIRDIALQHQEELNSKTLDQLCSGITFKSSDEEVEKIYLLQLAKRWLFVREWAINKLSN